MPHKVMAYCIGTGGLAVDLFYPGITAISKMKQYEAVVTSFVTLKSVQGLSSETIPDDIL